MNVLLGLPAIAALLLLTAVPILWLDARRAYLDLLWAHPSFFAALGLTWTAVGYWTTRRLAEWLLLRRSGAKVKMNA